MTKEEKVDESKEKPEPEDDNPRVSIHDVRAPVMLLYVCAAIGGHMSFISGQLMDPPQLGQTPLWAVLLGVVVLMFLLVFFMNRMNRLLLPVQWTVRNVIIGAFLFIPIFGLLWQAGNMLELLTGDWAWRIGKMQVQIRLQVEQSGYILAGLAGALLLAPLEEILWRGYIMHRLTMRTGTVAGVIISSLLHGGFWWLLVNPMAGVVATSCALIFAGLTLRAKAIAPAIICHSLLWIVGVWIYPLF